jgi:hypothetical protein
MKLSRAISISIFSLAALAPAGFSQITQVSGTVSDPTGIAYNPGVIKAQLVTTVGSPVTGTPTVTNNNQNQCVSAGLGSAPCQMPFQGTVGQFALSPTGSFTVTLQDNTQVTPAATQWLFTVNSTGTPPPVGTGPQVCTAQVTISGASQTISASFSCPALSLAGSGAGFNGVSTISTASYTATAKDNGKLLRFTGCLCNVTLPNPAPPGWSVTILNATTPVSPGNALLINPPGALTLNGSTNITQVMPDGATTVFSDGSNFFAANQVLMSNLNANPCGFYDGGSAYFYGGTCALKNSSNGNIFIVPAGVAISGPINLAGNPKARILLADQGQCTMAAGTCTAQSLASTYAATPLCFLTYTGTGTLAGTLKVASTTTTVTPSSTNAADTAQVNWACYGN